MKVTIITLPNGRVAVSDERPTINDWYVVKLYNVV